MTIKEAIEWMERYRSEWERECKSIHPMKEALQMAIAALKKQMGKKINEIHVDEYYCPACGAENNCDEGIVYDNYCPNCGQKIDWTKENNNEH